MLSSQKEVAARIRAGIPGRWAVGFGAYLQVQKTGDRPATASWLGRYERDGRTVWIGFGPFALVTLAEAREKARAMRKLRLAAIDPLRNKREERAKRRAEERARLSFRDAVKEFLALHEGSWRNEKHRWQWRTTLAGVFPRLGDWEVARIDAALINETVAPIWLKTPETASRTKQRIERVIGWVREGKPLPQPSAGKRVAHHAALAWQALPAFMERLRALVSISARALEFCILTAARTGEVIGARWDEIDLDHKLWTIPGSRMKTGKIHRVPLSAQALGILAAVPREEDNPHVFIGASSGKGLSNMAMLQCLRGLDVGLTVHGFRSCFKDWASEATHVDNMISEAALAHVVADKVEAAYRRGDLLQKRRKLMADWADYCASPPSGGVVVPLAARREPW